MRRRHPIIVQKPTEAQGDTGAVAITWSQFDAVRAERTSLGGNETLEPTGVVTGAREELNIYYRKGITPKMRVLAREEDTTLNGAVNATVTSITVASADGFPLAPETGVSPVPYRILIDSEILTVTAGHGSTTWKVTRAADGTTAATHANAVSVHRMQVLDIESAVDPTRRSVEMNLTVVAHG